MNIFCKKITALTIAALGVTLAGIGAAQADYPEKPVSFVVPFPPGDIEDVLTRMIAEDFSAKYNVRAAVINKPGGGGGPFPGAIEVAGAAADGYTIGSFVMDVPLVGPFIGIHTPADIREKIAAVANETMASDRAKEFAEQTGAVVYWQDATAANAQIEEDMVVMGRMAEILRQ